MVPSGSAAESIASPICGCIIASASPTAAASSLHDTGGASVVAIWFNAGDLILEKLTRTCAGVVLVRCALGSVIAVLFALHAIVGKVTIVPGGTAAESIVSPIGGYILSPTATASSLHDTGGA